MSGVFERPLTTRRAHPGLVLIKHDGLAPADSKRRKYPLELRPELRDAALGGIGMMKRKRIEMPRAAQMPRVEILGRPRVDEDQIGVVAMLPKPSRINNFFRIHFFRIHCLDLS